ncbi:hypothetical protein [Treponema putidum]|uniref:Uncharacterized protein n=1 Tax=Treponema putidum TaxID=221027 RepID=A0AAE9SKY1_9SPIR|nr:hypothetical protein [Treponema putidum]AIN93622.1 hypothetical protein JO40_05425 [Treponema putidum]TWI75504.1 hypothetical protein JM98_01953 [Treponema putidum]UTY29869.1 hypothetical protein E4N76_13520 [Treponema putidum]UTY32321.1 hypothetical protein E4N75_13280 [Treponema putidum]UTY34727.1 hypothetical protein E4N74_12480 [Treponema putidum]
MVGQIFNDEFLMSPEIKDIAVFEIPKFIDAADDEVVSSALKISKAFGRSASFEIYTDETKTDSEKNLIESFMKNIRLLVQKTWVEKDDEECKEDTLYRINSLCEKLTISEKPSVYKESFDECFAILQDVVALLFGDMVKADSFVEYAFRIDPAFGFFWYYVTRLSKVEIISDVKARYAVLLAMFFLANF